MRKQLRGLIGGLFVVLNVLGSTGAHANIGSTYGFGSRSSALAGAGAAWGFEAYSAYSNPAGLPVTTEGHRLAISYGILVMQPKFIPIDNVITENTYVSDKQTVGSVDTTYRATVGQALGLAYRLNETGSETLGLTAYLPLNQVAYMDTGETYQPEYVLYRARTQRPQFDLAFGGQVSTSLRLGGGFHIAYSLTSSANVVVRTATGKPSAMRFSGTLKPKVGPYLGFLLTPGEHPEDFSLGFVFRFPVSSDNEMSMRTSATIGPFLPIDFNFAALSALYYDPATFELGSSWQHASGWRLYVQADYQIWNRFKPSMIDITNGCGDAQTCGVALTPSNLPGFSYRNIVIPRIAEEAEIGGTIWRLGYSYQPSFLASLPSGAGNSLDPPKHVVTLGAGFKYQSFLGLKSPVRMDVHFAWNQMVTQHVTKTPGDEAGAGSGDQKIGAPGYDAGGKVLGGGVSLNWVF